MTGAYPIFCLLLIASCVAGLCISWAISVWVNLVLVFSLASLSARCFEGLGKRTRHQQVLFDDVQALRSQERLGTSYVCLDRGDLIQAGIEMSV